MAWHEEGLVASSDYRVIETEALPVSRLDLDQCSSRLECREGAIPRVLVSESTGRVLYPSLGYGVFARGAP